MTTVENKGESLIFAETNCFITAEYVVNLSLLHMERIVENVPENTEKDRLFRFDIKYKYKFSDVDLKTYGHSFVLVCELNLYYLIQSWQGLSRRVVFSLSIEKFNEIVRFLDELHISKNTSTLGKVYLCLNSPKELYCPELIENIEIYEKMYKLKDTWKNSVKKLIIDEDKIKKLDVNFDDVISTL